MLISLKHDFVFLCNRKCASISIEAMLRKHSDISLLGPPEFRHANYRLYRRHLAPFIEESTGRTNLRTVCLVREPLSWLYSFYRFRSRYELLDPMHPYHRNSTHGISFREFVRSYMQPAPPPYADVGCQFDFVKNGDDEIGVDSLFLYEDMDSFIHFMRAKFGHRLRIPYKNVSPKKTRRVRLAALTDRVVKTATALLHLRRLAVKPAVEAPLPGDLLASLEDFMRCDYVLYAQAKARASLPAASGAGRSTPTLARQRAIR